MTYTAIFSFARAADDVVDIRTITLDSQPCFVAVNICRCLGVNNVTHHTDKLDPTEKRHVARSTLNPDRGGSPMIVVSESGLTS